VSSSRELSRLADWLTSDIVISPRIGGAVLTPRAGGAMLTPRAGSTLFSTPPLMPCSPMLVGMSFSWYV
jgi:hypothetical protein